MKRFFVMLVIAGLSVIHVASAQNSKYMVFLKNKKNTTFNPYSYFDKKAIERRLQNGIPLSDSTDFPLNADYVAAVSNLADSVSHQSRWFNSIAVYSTNEKIKLIENLPFVSSVEILDATCNYAEYKASDWDTTISGSLADIMEKQINRMGGDLFAKSGIDGKGIRIAIFDGGFPNVDTSPAFENIRKEGRLLKTWDFTRNREYVYDYISHGTMVMSCIGGMINGKKIGMATGAEFMLARTEVKAEPFSEEENWLAAVEWADKNGADIINSSLGYTYHRYFRSQMDGKTSLVARAANLAAKKGILVVNAAGNEGTSDWKIIGTPADADSALSVGGIDPDLDYHISFSSYGPTWDKRFKPNVCAFGHVTAAGKNGLAAVDGTSFASPLTAGFAACAWQINKSLNNMQLYGEIEKSADLYPYFDYAHGYGVPQAAYFTDPGKSNADSTFDFVAEDGYVKVMAKKDYIDRKVKGSKGYLYYNIQNANGILKEYFVLSVYQEEVLKLKISDFTKGQKINVHYGNYTGSYEF